MDIKIIKAALLRFVRSFIAGGVAAVAVMLASGVTVRTLDELNAFCQAIMFTFFVGAVSGILQAADKVMRDLRVY